MQNVSRLGLMIAVSSLIMVGQSAASGRAIAEDPQFRAAWKAYKTMTPEARAHQQHFSAFSIAPVRSASRDTPPASFARHIEADSPQAICEVVSARVRYTPDEADYWQTGAETWNRRAGDCEDFAALVRDLCRARGFDAKMVIFHAKAINDAHAVVIGNHNGTVWMSSNGDYQAVGTIAKARDIVMRDLRWSQGEVVAYNVNGQGQQQPMLTLLEDSRSRS